MDTEKVILAILWYRIIGKKIKIQGKMKIFMRRSFSYV